MPYCPGKAMTNGGQILWSNGHNHGSNPVMLRAKVAERRVMAVRYYIPTVLENRLIILALFPDTGGAW
jgi:hypothetical protein